MTMPPPARHEQHARSSSAPRSATTEAYCAMSSSAGGNLPSLTLVASSHAVAAETSTPLAGSSINSRPTVPSRSGAPTAHTKAWVSSSSVVTPSRTYVRSNCSPVGAYLCLCIGRILQPPTVGSLAGVHPETVTHRDSGGAPTRRTTVVALVGESWTMKLMRRLLGLSGSSGLGLDEL
jgi:hypothetical protein